MDITTYALLKKKLDEKAAILDAGLTPIVSIKDGVVSGGMTDEIWILLSSGNADVFANVNGVLIKPQYNNGDVLPSGGSLILLNSDSYPIITITNNNGEYTYTPETGYSDIDISIVKKGVVVSGDELSWVSGSGQDSAKTRTASDASGSGAVAEGFSTMAVGDYSHAEGRTTQTNNIASHAEGENTNAHGRSSHSEGYGTMAYASYAHAEGYQTEVSDAYSHAEGAYTYTGDRGAHAGGLNTSANASFMTAIGIRNVLATKYNPYIPGHQYYAGDMVTYTNPRNQELVSTFRCLRDTNASAFDLTEWTIESDSDGNTAFVIGNGLYNSQRSNAMRVDWSGNTEISGSLLMGDSINPSSVGNDVLVHGNGNLAEGDYSHAEGESAAASGYASHAEGVNTQANADYSHAEGYQSYANQLSSHAEGEKTNANAAASHAEGYQTSTNDYYSHTEGWQTSTNTGAVGSHAEGALSGTYAPFSHAEGIWTLASGIGAHSSGMFTDAGTSCMTAIGIHNVPSTVFNEWVSGNTYAVGDVVWYADPEAFEGLLRQTYVCTTANSDTVFDSSKWSLKTSSDGEMAFVIGNGIFNGQSSNAMSVDWDGNEYLAGDIYINCNRDSTGGERLGTREVTVAGTTPTIAAEANTRYVCGECSTLSITPCATGICDIIFTSGSTATVLTLPNTVKIPDWFVVEAGRTYEINILNGVYGVVMSWAT